MWKCGNVVTRCVWELETDEQDVVRSKMFGTYWSKDIGREVKVLKERCGRYKSVLKVATP